MRRIFFFDPQNAARLFCHRQGGDGGAGAFAGFYSGPKHAQELEQLPRLGVKVGRLNDKPNDILLKALESDPVAFVDLPEDLVSQVCEKQQYDDPQNVVGLFNGRLRRMLAIVPFETEPQDELFAFEHLWLLAYRLVDDINAVSLHWLAYPLFGEIQTTAMDTGRKPNSGRCLDRLQRWREWCEARQHLSQQLRLQKVLRNHPDMRLFAEGCFGNKTANLVAPGCMPRNQRNESLVTVHDMPRFMTVEEVEQVRRVAKEPLPKPFWRRQGDKQKPQITTVKPNNRDIPGTVAGIDRKLSKSSPS